MTILCECGHTERDHWNREVDGVHVRVACAIRTACPCKQFKPASSEAGADWFAKFLTWLDVLDARVSPESRAYARAEIIAHVRTAASPVSEPQYAREYVEHLERELGNAQEQLSPTSAQGWADTNLAWPGLSHHQVESIRDWLHKYENAPHRNLRLMDDDDGRVCSIHREWWKQLLSLGPASEQEVDTARLDWLDKFTITALDDRALPALYSCPSQLRARIDEELAATHMPSEQATADE